LSIVQGLISVAGGEHGANMRGGELIRNAVVLRAWWWQPRQPPLTQPQGMRIKIQNGGQQAPQRSQSQPPRAAPMQRQFAAAPRAAPMQRQQVPPPSKPLLRPGTRTLMSQHQLHHVDESTPTAPHCL
jgi:hypothetical protein